MSSMLFLAGCGSADTNTVTVQDFTFAAPTTFQTVSSASLDNAQIVHSVIAAWKWTNSSLVLSESTLPSTVSLESFTQDTQSRLGKELVWYSAGKISSTSFTCNGKKIAAYKHSFAQNDFQDATKIAAYYNQLYFARNDSVYILSLAQQEENSIFNDIVDSLGCVTK